MANLIKYHSDINKIPLKNFNEKEINLFFSLIFKAREEGTNKIKINFTDLKRISNGNIHSDRFIKTINNLNDKLLKLNQKITLPDGKIVMFNLFNEFVVDPVNKELEIQIHERFYYMLNDFLTYTQFELEQFMSLRSSYSKHLFKLLKQFESTNFLSIYIDEFKKILCIPESYKMGEIDRRVIKPAMEELSPLFPDLKLEKIKDGRKIKSLKFTWSNNCSIKDKPIVEIKISEQLNKIIEKTKKNSFINPLLNILNVQRLIKKYPEDLLIKGLNFAIQEINYEIKSFSYLEKTIDTGIANSKKKIVIEITQKKLEIKKEDQLESSNIDSKAIYYLIKEFKANIARWCIKNKKFSLFGEIEDTTSYKELNTFLEKYRIEI